MVAAWIRAETGVGPAMASGSQTMRGTWADFPMAPARNSSPRAVTTPTGMRNPIWLIWVMDSVWKSWKHQTMPMPKAVSPMRVVMKALRPAVTFFGSVYQKPMRA